MLDVIFNETHGQIIFLVILAALLLVMPIAVPFVILVLWAVHSLTGGY